ncbi:uncharacterized protein LOC125662133 [Ostrea edulis]|uniref:uncharacterized protein LOC125662133 n=1 Tax=Ostrea edulis TaxID=37623 RepID=UPI0024AEF099|nr:uncharacterized protein LOC125662133 [Ostrea edulis]
MATTIQTVAGLSLLIHTVLFTSLNLYIYLRTQSLSQQYQQESEVLELLEKECERSQHVWSVDEVQELLELPALNDVAERNKRQTPTLQMMMADILKAQELVLEQHCINNTHLCVYGAKGEIGTPGSKGVTGEKGEPGLQPQRGFPGIAGSKGEFGLPGLQGAVGPKGDLGKLGEKGDIGQKGDKGDQGDMGSKGVKGDPGISGEKGDVGVSGPPGDRGETGGPGKKGERGPQGPRGFPGDKGDVGPSGAPGKSLGPQCLCKAPKLKDDIIQSRILDRVMMSCPTGNNTVLNITWTKDASSEIPVRMLQTRNNIVLPEVYPGDSGIYRCTALVLDSDGKTGTVQHKFEIQIASGNDSHDCDFEKDLCTWTQSTTDNFDLLRHQGNTPTALTGPASDHTIGGSPGGHYLYLESSNQKPGDKAVLVSSDFTNTTPQCLTFWYHMYGPDTASLRVILTGNSNSTIWKKSGDQGKDWQRAIVEIPTSLKRHQIMLEVTEGANYLGDIAIDDIIVLDGPCADFNKTPQ